MDTTKRIIPPALRSIIIEVHQVLTVISTDPVFCLLIGFEIGADGSMSTVTVRLGSGGGSAATIYGSLSMQVAQK